GKLRVVAARRIQQQRNLLPVEPYGSGGSAVDTAELQRRAQQQAEDDGSPGSAGEEDRAEMTTAELALRLSRAGMAPATASRTSAATLERTARQALKGGNTRGLSGQHARSCTNAALSSRMMKEHCRLDEAGRSLLTRAVERLGLSA